MAQSKHDPILKDIPSQVLAGLSTTSPFYHDRVVDSLLKFRKNLSSAAFSTRIGVDTERAWKRLQRVEVIVCEYIDAYGLNREDDPRKEQLSKVA